MQSNTNILISGAGIAGLTLAYWLDKFGFAPVLVERRADLSDEGYMIDFYGSGFDVAEKMELIDPLRTRHYAIPELSFVDSQGNTRSSLDVQKFRRVLDYRHFNFMRGDLAQVLYEAVCGCVPIRFGTSIAALRADADGVQVELSDGSEKT